ncbi:iron chelate uptake ABC transporter family permease subunit [Methylosinus sporium]|uniref:iron chelate uptake ABC transporter family permease subunit n=1 Tax=Methylosinus sporium TaxID=428 RepID=UPI003839F80D
MPLAGPLDERVDRPAQVAVSGGVGWVGLIIPHFGRMLVGPDHRVLLPASALLGGLYLLAVDTIARAATNQEIPLGLLTALIGAPIFGYLLWRTHLRGWGGRD